MNLRIFADEAALAHAAAAHAAGLLRQAIAARGRARLLVGAEASQAPLLAALVLEPGVAWSEVEVFHTGELEGVAIDHAASSRRFLIEHLIAKVRPGRYHLLDAANNSDHVCRDAGAQLGAAPIDVACFGCDDHGGIGFNEPPADFGSETPYLIVRLDHPEQRRRLADHGFESAADVPDRAICLSLRQLLKADALICFAAGANKAAAMRRCFESAVSPLAPASVLQTHPDATVYLDRKAAALLKSQAARL